MKFTIGIFQRGTNPHAACFEDVAFALRDSLKALGHETLPFDVRGLPLGRMIMMGVNNSSIDVASREARHQLPEDAIVFNTEQLAAVDDPERYMQNYPYYRKHVVWDYSAANIATMRTRFGFTRAVHCPIGYIDTMTTIVPAPEEDVDVLFYGSTNPHRLKILDGLDEAGLKVKRLFGVYGKERDAWIARSKVVLNMHHYERGVFEIFRVSHLVANHKCVVTEEGGVDKDLNEQGRRMAWSVEYDQIVDACVELVRNPTRRVMVADNAFKFFSGLKFTDHVARALEQS